MNRKDFVKAALLASLAGATMKLNALNKLVENYDETDNRLNGSRSGQILDGNVELLNFTTTTNLDSRRRDRRVEGYFSRINYDFNEKYFASFSARRDGSSKFFKDTKFIKPWSLINKLSIRIVKIKVF